MTHAGNAVEAENEVALLTAALALARGDEKSASRGLEQRLQRLAERRTHLGIALDLLVDARLSAATSPEPPPPLRRLDEVAATASSPQIAALAAGAAGRLFAARGDTEEAVARFDVSLKIWSALQLPYEVARTRLDLAMALASAQPDVAVDHARIALTGFEKLGASVEADRTAAFLRSAGVTGRSVPKSGGVLTRREEEVLRLLGAGLSNPEIAERLFVSRKTASHHVSSILAKLNLRNRSEAAAHAVATLGMSTRLLRRRLEPDAVSGNCPMCSTCRLSMMTVMTTSTESFQIPIEAAEAYEDAFVPAFFAQWAPLLCEAVMLDRRPAGPRRGMRHRDRRPNCCRHRWAAKCDRP